MKAVSSAFFLILLFLQALPGRGLAAEGLVGTWQGKTGAQQRVLVVSPGPRGALRGDFYNLGMDARANPVSKIEVHATEVSFALDYAAGRFTGKLAPDGKSLVGQWEARGNSQSLIFTRASKAGAWVIDPSPHTPRFIPVAGDVRLEVLDWGGSGPPLVFLAGLGNSAHVFDALAPKFTNKHHVYGITRRGYTPSSAPAPTDENYDADRLGDDVLAVIRALKLDRPVIVGHSVAGEELSSVGTRHPEEVAALVYLDAAFAYAFYDPNGEKRVDVEASSLRRALRQLGTALADPSRLVALNPDIQAAVGQFQAALQEWVRIAELMPASPQGQQTAAQTLIANAILVNQRKYGAVKVPALVIAAVPHQCAPNCDGAYAKWDAAASAAQVDAVARGSSARVVRLPYADHFVWLTNEADVLREMNAFLGDIAP
jgi:pimeloyl-ACP methyl ester carboxylesterase